MTPETRTSETRTVRIVCRDAADAERVEGIIRSVLATIPKPRLDTLIDLVLALRSAESISIHEPAREPAPATPEASPTRFNTHAPTPGPWRVGAGCVVADSERGTHVDPRDAEFYGGHLVCESIKSKANARLIAAAPELLAACRALADADNVTDRVAAWRLACTAVRKADNG